MTVALTGLSPVQARESAAAGLINPPPASRRCRDEGIGAAPAETAERIAELARSWAKPDSG